MYVCVYIQLYMYAYIIVQRIMVHSPTSLRTLRTYVHYVRKFSGSLVTKFTQYNIVRYMYAICMYVHIRIHGTCY